jgi:hypothetical protein
VRSTNVEFQRWIDEFYESFLNDQGISFTKITGSIDERKHQVLAAIK